MDGVLDDNNLNRYGSYKLLQIWIDTSACIRPLRQCKILYKQQEMSKKWNLHWLHKQPSHATNRGRNITIQKITIKCNRCVIFDSIQSPLMGGSKLVNNWCTTIFCDTQSTTILSGITKNTIRKIITEAKMTQTTMIYWRPFRLALLHSHGKQ